MNNPVGPVLRMGDEVEQVIAALEDDNPGNLLEITDRGAYVRVEGEDSLTLTQDTLRRYLGPDTDISMIGTMMSAFSGRVVTTSDSISWQSIRKAATA